MSLALISSRKCRSQLSKLVLRHTRSVSWKAIKEEANEFAERLSMRLGFQPPNALSADFVKWAHNKDTFDAAHWKLFYNDTGAHRASAMAVLLFWLLAGGSVFTVFYQTIGKERSWEETLTAFSTYLRRMARTGSFMAEIDSEEGQSVSTKPPPLKERLIFLLNHDFFSFDEGDFLLVGLLASVVLWALFRLRQTCVLRMYQNVHDHNQLTAVGRNLFGWPTRREFALNSVTLDAERWRQQAVYLRLRGNLALGRKQRSVFISEACFGGKARCYAFLDADASRLARCNNLILKDDADWLEN